MGFLGVLAMKSLARRVDRIEERLEPDKDNAGVTIDLGDGILRRLPSGFTLNNPQVALGVAKARERQTNGHQQPA